MNFLKAYMHLNADFFGDFKQNTSMREYFTGNKNVNILAFISKVFDVMDTFTYLEFMCSFEVEKFFALNK